MQQIVQENCIGLMIQDTKYGTLSCTTIQIGIHGICANITSCSQLVTSVSLGETQSSVYTYMYQNKSGKQMYNRHLFQTSYKRFSTLSNQQLFTYNLVPFIVLSSQQIQLPTPFSDTNTLSTTSV